MHTLDLAEHTHGQVLCEGASSSLGTSSQLSLPEAHSKFSSLGSRSSGRSSLAMSNGKFLSLGKPSLHISPTQEAFCSS